MSVAVDGLSPKANVPAYAAGSRVPFGCYLGMFIISFTTLMYELLLTRLFSVITLYHFTFMAVSLALFGATGGALSVHLRPRRFAADAVLRQMGKACIASGLAMVASIAVLCYVPFATYGWSVLGEASGYRNILNTALVVIAITLPFYFSGICITLALTRFPAKVGKLYAVDLVGAALGCAALVVVLDYSDGPTAVLIAAALAACAGLAFLSSVRGTPLLVASSVIAIALAVFAGWHENQLTKGQPLLRLNYVKGFYEDEALYEKWNSFSRVRVTGDMKEPVLAFNWGLSAQYKPPKLRQLELQIDGSANTPLTYFTGNLDRLQFLKYEIVNTAHYLRSNAKVLAIGAGGGRDILSALVFNQKSVTGVEINNAIFDSVTNRFGDFAGHIDELPNVHLVNDEARSFVTRSKDLFDIIQISLIDTWAASSAGAYVLTENTLYTVEAWKTFLQHLEPNGILTSSRWYNNLGPTEIYRLTAVAVEALRQIGVTDPRGHLLALRKEGYQPGVYGLSVATLLVSPKPFSEPDIACFSYFANDWDFKVILSPDVAEDPILQQIADGDVETAAEQVRLNISPATDDSPFFFNAVHFRDVFTTSVWENEFFRFNMKAVTLLGILVVIVGTLTLLCIIVPLAVFDRRRHRGRGFWPLLGFFSCIGMGFMFIEISQMQRLSVFLGHPTYGLTVVLFTVLLASGVGSGLTSLLAEHRRGWRALVALLLVLCAFGFLTPLLTTHFRSASTPVRIAVAIGMLAPMGLVLGMAFPLGMRLAAENCPRATAWMWGMNGAMSVCASVLAVSISLFASITAAYWVGAACYVLALLFYARAAQIPPSTELGNEGNFAPAI